MFWSTDEQDALLLLFSCSIVSNFLRPRELQHARLPCPSLSPKVCSNSHPLSQWCHPTISSSVIPFSSHLQSPSIRVFSNESIFCIRWPKYWSFSFRIFRTDSFRIDWLALLLVQGTLKSLLQHHSSKASIVRCSAFFVVQLSHPYMATGKAKGFTRWTFVDKVMFLNSNTLSMLVIAFLSRSKHLLISRLQSPSAVILEPQNNKVWQCFHCFPIYFPWSDGTRCHDLRFLNVEL